MKMKTAPKPRHDEIPPSYPVQPITPIGHAGEATCGTCGLTWDDDKITGMTPVPSGRCPFEYFHRNSK